MTEHDEPEIPPDETASEYYERRANERAAFEAGVDARASGGVTPAPARIEGVRNRGASDYYQGEPEETEPQAEDERVDFAHLMQPENKDRSRVNREGKSISPGGGGSGAGKAKDRKLSFGGNGSASASGPDEDLSNLVQFRVANLTLGERTYYDARGMEARSVLERVDAEIQCGGFPVESWRNVAPNVAGPDLVVYVSPDMSERLGSRPGLARYALAQNARERDGKRIARWDEGQPAPAPVAQAPAWIEQIGEDELRRQVDLIRSAGGAV